ncbi:MAG: TonB-dependent receptor plug domain-containing protein [Bacteroidales bacterium]|nr:TonB-dependent receptor plug domain-containing protein [Bacteroidales bacterium]
MKKYLLYILLLSIPATLFAQQESITKRIFQIDEATIYADRPMKEIGIQKTSFDSVRLKENIALSVADILTYNSSIFVKSHGRATLSTVAFRGTSASHTQVSWNGMKINNPMLGSTDFSMIPSYFIDDASLLHGTSSVNEIGGGLGGAVKLSTTPANNNGFGLQYIQGIGSFKTFDEFLRITYGTPKWQISTRAVLSTSANDFKYRNHDKKENIYDENMNIIEQYYPVETNKSGSFRDFHILQEVYYNTLKGDRFGLNAWYINSNRELPLLTTDYSDATEFDNRQREQTFRGIINWDHLRSNWKLSAKGGYIYTWMAYDYKRDIGNGIMSEMTRSRSTINTIYGNAEGEYYIGKKWLFTASLSAHQHFVTSKDKNIIRQDGDKAIVGYQKGRIELSGAISAKWKPIEEMGISVVLREEMYGTVFTPIIPALFIDGVICKKGNIVAKASISRNYRFPSLNDLYFLPGGNPDLKNESGWSYDAGISFSTGKEGIYTLSGSATWFDSYIHDWIIWLPTTKGFFSPRNIKDVHAYGVEIEGKLDWIFAREWKLDIGANFSWTPSINNGEPVSIADQSVGKQLPYVPEYSSSINGRLSWRGWAFTYKWCYYSQRYTMSSNDISLTGKLPSYFMSNIVLEKNLNFKWADLSIKGAINNLFNEEYLSVLSRPMPGINFEIFVGITPKF